jgi:hypothetical protein
MKLFEVLFLFESDDLFTNKDHDIKSAKLKLASINTIIKDVSTQSTRYDKLIKTRCDMLSIIRDKAYLTALTTPALAYDYARHTVDGPWPEGEPVILQDAYYSYAYARFILGDRWSKGEPVIMTNIHQAASYAHYVIQGRWPEAEAMILNSSYKEKYLELLASKGITLPH